MINTLGLMASTVLPAFSATAFQLFGSSESFQIAFVSFGLPCGSFFRSNAITVSSV